MVLPTIALMLCVSPAQGLPPGRAWTPVEAFRVPGHTRLIPLWMDTDTSGNPVVFTEGVGGIGQNTFGCHWADSSWAVTWAGGFASSVSWPVLSPRGTHYLLWKSITGEETPTGPKAYLVMTQVDPVYSAEHDTLGLIWGQASEYNAAASEQRRWVVVQDFTNLRLLYSDTLRSWHEVEVAGQGEGGQGVATLDDTTAIVAWAGLNEGVRWGVLRGATWTEGVPLDVTDRLANRPRFRPRPSGGHWLSWASVGRDFVSIRTYRDGAWSEPESLHCAYPYPEDHWTGSADLSRDDGEYPAVAWGETSPIGRETICVCMPTDAGFTTGEHLPFRGLPTIARDRHGDVWVAWWDPATIMGMFWLHTYNHATAEDVHIEGHGRGRRVAWTLSEPAPETWWAILRAGGHGNFEAVARVRAGPSLNMSWTDSSQPAGQLRYKIRRESVDTRHQWESPIVRSPERGRGLALKLASPLPIAREGALLLADASPGRLELRLYDLQGRIVLQRLVAAVGSGEETIRFDIDEATSPLRNGIYFAAVRDAAGETSESVKLVILR